LYKKNIRRKKWYFCLFKTPTQGVSLWHFHVYMYYSLIWLISSIFSSFYLNLFLTVVLTSLKILHSLFYRTYINHIQLLNFLHFLFIYSYVHTFFGPFLSLTPTSSLSLHCPPHFQAESVLPLSLILLKRKHKQ
jgi:hypothetical protein